MSPNPTVFVIDDDPALRDSLRFLLESADLKAECFACAEDFQSHYDNSRPGCILLDIRMPGMSGLELQELLSKDRLAPPVILITGHGDVQIAVRALKAGAHDFIEKPFSDQVLLECIDGALDRDRVQRDRMQLQIEAEACYDRLTARERQVFRLVVDGDPNKVIAAKLELSQKTVEVHRAHVMEKMEAPSFAHLVKMSVLLESTEEARD